MTPTLADAAPVTDLLDVFNTYDGNVVFRGLTVGSGGQPAVLGRLGWIFTGFGALFVLWGFMLRSSRGGEEKLGEIAKTVVILGCMVGGPFMMRTAMEAADGIYAASPGNPANLPAACVKAALALPEVGHLLDILGRNAAAAPPGPSPAPAGSPALLRGPTDGSVLGYLEAYGSLAWHTAAGTVADAGRNWDSMVHILTVVNGVGSAVYKCLLLALIVLPLYFLLLVAAAIVWFMQQLRFFLAVSGTMMLPLFVGLYSLPEGHANRQAAQGYVMNMVSLALWPVAWAIGHTGTIALYDALIALIAGTGRVPQIGTILQWSSVNASTPTEAQLQVMEAALGNWFMGNLSSLLADLVGGIGFVLWVVAVSVFGPAFLHKLLTAGALFMSEAAAGTGRLGMAAGRQVLAFGQKARAAGTNSLSDSGPKDEESASKSTAGPNTDLFSVPPRLLKGVGSSLADAARQIDNSDGKSSPRM